jgi:hypothetical protein
MYACEKKTPPLWRGEAHKGREKQQRTQAGCETTAAQHMCRVLARSTTRGIEEIGGKHNKKKEKARLPGHPRHESSLFFFRSFVFLIFVRVRAVTVMTTAKQ